MIGSKTKILKIKQWLLVKDLLAIGAQSMTRTGRVNSTRTEYLINQYTNLDIDMLTKYREFMATIGGTFKL